MFISNTVFCGNDLSMPVSHCTKGKIIILVLNLFPSKFIECPFVPLWHNDTACVKISYYFMNLISSLSNVISQNSFLCFMCENKKSWIPALKGILLLCTHVLTHMSLCFQKNRACVPPANLDSWLLEIKKKKLRSYIFSFSYT